jgi:Domain of unknown function (DUF3536)/Glycosyl hydrolase family 57
VSRPRLIVHGHFYQPSRIDPGTGTVPADHTAAPWRDWNTRIAADCYRPNAELGNYGRISWDLGPTLAGWLETGDPIAYRGFVDGDGGRQGMAQPYHHTILPLATPADRRTEIRWGLRDFEWRFGRRPTGVWLPETAVDLDTLGLLVDEGVTHTILAPWQLAGEGLDTRRPYRVEVAGGRAITVLAYDAGLSTSVSFETEATTDADRFARERVVPRLGEPFDGDGTPFALIATDGELYGHHQPYRDLFLQRLVGPADLGYEVATLADVVAGAGAGARHATVVERSSWSCHHGVARWETACDCVGDGAWKAPLRAAFDRLATAIDERTEALARSLPGAPDPWAARDAYVDVVIGARDVASFDRDWLPDADVGSRRTFATLMAAQRWRLAMYASCGWFWETPDRVETLGVIRAAAHAAALVDGLGDTRLGEALHADLQAVESVSPRPARHGLTLDAVGG